MKKTFKGIAQLSGDDGFCYGIHLTFKGEKNAEDTVVIDWLDEIAGKFSGKEIEVTIEVKGVRNHVQRVDSRRRV